MAGGIRASPGIMGGMYMAAAAAAAIAAAAAAWACSGVALGAMLTGGDSMAEKGADIAGIMAGTIGTMLAAEKACACVWSTADCWPAYCRGVLVKAAMDVTGYHCGICHIRPAAGIAAAPLPAQKPA
jgi:hypothetical protein